MKPTQNKSRQNALHKQSQLRKYTKAQTQPQQTRLFAFNKPFQVLCQFSAAEDKKTLADFFTIPNMYPAGRLDFDSEGLVLLTNNGKLQHAISHPAHKLVKTYLVQVEGTPTTAQLKTLCEGVELKDGLTEPARVRICPNQTPFPPRVPPIRVRKHIPDTWIEMQISQGRNRQVRRMTAAVGLPTLRLIRTQIGDYSLANIEIGCFQEVFDFKTL